MKALAITTNLQLNPSTEKRKTGAKVTRVARCSLPSSSRLITTKVVFKICQLLTCIASQPSRVSWASPVGCCPPGPASSHNPSAPLTFQREVFLSVSLKTEFPLSNLSKLPRVVENHEDTWNRQQEVGKLFCVPVCEETIVPVNLSTGHV